MPRIPSYNPDFTALTEPSSNPGYMHGASVRQSYIPVAFQVTSPYDFTKVLLPHALVMHVNPANFNEASTKKVERIQTRGGWVEQHWGDELMEISADGSTGAFMNIYTGLSSIVRRRTIAWDRFRDLHDLYRNNGSIWDPNGAIVLQGQIMLMYDKGTYLGTFRTFDFEESADTPFVFHISWAFKVTKVIFQMPSLGMGKPLFGPGARVPNFQSKNTLAGTNAMAQAGLDKAAQDKATQDATEARRKQAETDSRKQDIQGIAQDFTSSMTGIVKNAMPTTTDPSPWGQKVPSGGLVPDTSRGSNLELSKK